MRKTTVALALTAILGTISAGQQITTRQPDVEVPPDMTAQKDLVAASKDLSQISDGRLRSFAKDFLQDQKEIWTSPARLQPSDADWLVPISGITAGLFVTDASFSRHLSHNPATLTHYSSLSNEGLAALVGGAGGMWLLGHVKHNAHWSETGFLAGEAALNSFAAVEGLKYTIRRDRPLQDNGSGAFFQSGGTSFPSEHSAAAWAIAGVIAHEYPGPLTKTLVYGLASLISFSRIRSEQHFPSDVVVGTVLGNLIAQNIYSRRHDPELGGGEWRSIGEFVRGDKSSSPANFGSPYVPMDSWVYAALERLAALGYINTGVLGQQPWTRLECARLVDEAAQRIEQAEQYNSRPGRILSDLQTEFRGDLELLGNGENETVQVESVYTRFTGIAGPPLTDSYHFGQTITDDFGRPYQEGLSNVSGFSGWVTEGRWVAYVRGEYQEAPSGLAYSDTVRNFIAQADANPILPGTPIAAHSQMQLLDAYVGLTLDNWQLSYGQQTLSWGPGRIGPFLFSDNAAPVRMLQLNRTKPIQLPWIFRYLGPTRFDLFFGNLAGHEFPPNPFIHGEKISFKPTRNLEFGFSRTAVLGGEGRPLTLGAVWNSYTSATSGFNVQASQNPGKRTGGFDFTYRVPGLRDWLTVYADSISDDDPSPLAAPRRAGINPGLYFPQIPGLRNLDLRVEAAYTDTPSSGPPPGKFIYFDSFYHDLYTNNGQLLGDWVGRDGTGLQAWSRYWLDGRSYVEVSYRHATVDPGFVPGGGLINDGSITVSFWHAKNWNVDLGVQYEQWKFPILAKGPQTNVVSTIGISYFPTRGRSRRRELTKDDPSACQGPGPCN